METELDNLICDIASTIRNLNRLHGDVCKAASEATKLDDEKRDLALADLQHLSASLRRAVVCLQSGTIKTSFFAAEK